jgi:predicted  nucleic acid-binding Zn-ribbon protein
MLSRIKDIFDDWASSYKVDDYDISLHEWIKSLMDRIDDLEDKNVWLRSEIKRLSEENIETTNSLYELENKIDLMYDDKSLKNFNLGDS